VASGQWSAASEDPGSGEPTPQTHNEGGVAGGRWRVASEDGVASESGGSGKLAPQVTSEDGVAINPKSAIQNPKSSGVLRALLAAGNPLLPTIRGRGLR